MRCFQGSMAADTSMSHRSQYVPDCLVPKAQSYTFSRAALCHPDMRTTRPRLNFACFQTDDSRRPWMSGRRCTAVQKDLSFETIRRSLAGWLDASDADGGAWSGAWRPPTCMYNVCTSTLLDRDRTRDQQRIQIRQISHSRGRAQHPRRVSIYDVVQDLLDSPGNVCCISDGDTGEQHNAGDGSL